MGLWSLCKTKFVFLPEVFSPIFIPFRSFSLKWVQGFWGSGPGLSWTRSHYFFLRKPIRAHINHILCKDTHAVYSHMHNHCHARVSRMSQWGTLNLCHVEQDAGVNHRFERDKTHFFLQEQRWPQSFLCGFLSVSQFQRSVLSSFLL